MRDPRRAGSGAAAWESRGAHAPSMRMWLVPTLLPDASSSSVTRAPNFQVAQIVPANPIPAKQMPAFRPISIKKHTSAAKCSDRRGKACFLRQVAIYRVDSSVHSCIVDDAPHKMKESMDEDIQPSASGMLPGAAPGIKKPAFETEDGFSGETATAGVSLRSCPCHPVGRTSA